jgi:hypothetical protein
VATPRARESKYFGIYARPKVIMFYLWNLPLLCLLAEPVDLDAWEIFYVEQMPTTDAIYRRFQTQAVHHNNHFAPDN